MDDLHVRQGGRVTGGWYGFWDNERKERQLQDEADADDCASGDPSDENRQVAPGRKPNAEVRTREYLTVAEVERLVKYAFIAI